MGNNVRRDRDEDDAFDEVEVVEEDDTGDDDYVLANGNDDSDDYSSKPKPQSRYRSNEGDDLDDDAIRKVVKNNTSESDTLILSIVEQRKRAEKLEDDYLGAEVRNFQATYQSKINELETYEHAIAEALHETDGIKLQVSIRLRDEAQHAVREMDKLWASANADYEMRKGSAPARVKELGAAFCKTHGWDNLSEPMRKKWLKVDQKVVEAGYDPTSPEYYKKLENSLKGLGLLNNSKSKTSSNSSQQKQSNSNSNGGSRTIHLSRERVEAIQSAGYERGSKGFIRMAKAYAKYDDAGGASAERRWDVGG